MDVRVGLKINLVRKGKSTYALNYVHILKSRDITLSTTVQIVKAMVFPVVMYGCENWTIKKVEQSSCHLFLISSASVRSIPFLSFIEPVFA